MEAMDVDDGVQNQQRTQSPLPNPEAPRTRREQINLHPYLTGVLAIFTFVQVDS